MLITKGSATLTPDDGSDVVKIGAGDSVYFHKGFACMWHVTKPMAKHYAYVRRRPRQTAQLHHTLVPAAHTHLSRTPHTPAHTHLTRFHLGRSMVRTARRRGRTMGPRSGARASAATRARRTASPSRTCAARRTSAPHATGSRSRPTPRTPSTSVKAWPCLSTRRPRPRKRKTVVARRPSSEVLGPEIRGD